MSATGFRSVLRRDILSLCLFVFIADGIAGLILPSFSLYAKSLGASVVFIGLLSSINGLTALLCAVPLGMLSDRLGRRRLLLIGIAGWSLACLVLALSPNHYLLIPGRVLMGVSMILSMGLGAALLGDLTSGRERAYAFGLYTTSMGLGFAVGPLVGGYASSNWGTAESYALGILIGLSGLLFSWRTLPRDPRRQDRPAGDQLRTPTMFGQIRTVLGAGGMRVACLVAFLEALAFSAAIVNFLPLYAEEALIGQAAIATMFSLRAFASTGVRLPSGVLAANTSVRMTLMLGLVLTCLALVGIGQTTERVLLTVLLVIEGAGFGVINAAGQAFVAEQSTTATRGAAVGLYRTASAIGSATCPILLGVIAGSWGLAVVFHVTAAAVVAGTVLAGLSLYGVLPTRRSAIQAPR